jgi:phosphopantothenoylcysteine decarboxylase/phosphopantothenate--cysteine ligase
MLSGKKILLGISGSIAAYKAADLARRLIERRAEVRIVMTQAATRFVVPLTFEAISSRPVLTDEFAWSGWGPMGHITATEGLDCALVAPATANIIGKMAAGIADDALSTSLMAAACPIILAPAMNERMYQNAILQRNISALRDAGVRILDPERGALACGDVGQGRLASLEQILDAVRDAVNPLKNLAGTKVVVTAGPTREPIDAVRFISNPSTGKMGYALAKAARDRGAEVVLISGPTMIVPPRGVQLVPVTTAAEMGEAVREQAAHAGVVIMAAAVSDFRPVHSVDHKIKKEDAAHVVHLVRTDDILMGLGREKGSRILVGFAAETSDLVENAMLKLERKNLDLIVANPVGVNEAGFGSDMNRAHIIDRSGSIVELPVMSKEELAARILDKVGELKTNQGL